MKYGRVMFAIAIVAFGIQHFIYNDFIMGRAPSWPEGQLVWAYGSGLLLILLGIAIFFNKKARHAAITVALLVLTWALLRHVLNEHWQWGTQITNTGKAWMLFGGSLVMATSAPLSATSLSKAFFIIGKATLGAFLVICGIQHFMFVEFVSQLIPTWIPGKIYLTYFTGLALIAGGVGIQINKLTKMASLLSGGMIFIWFLVLHIPRAVLGLGTGKEWVAVVEALAVSGIAFTIYGIKSIKMSKSS